MTRWVLTAILFFLFMTFVAVAQVKEPTIIRKQVSLEICWCLTPTILETPEGNYGRDI